MSVPSHAFPPGSVRRNRSRPRRARLQRNLRHLRDWMTWAYICAFLAALWLSGSMVDHFWPKAHGAGYVVTHILAGGVLVGAIGAVLLVLVVILAGVGGNRRRQDCAVPATRRAR
ncbi:MAG: hypothetical protein J2P28_03260 [Actinobacteria bacterium]|nr:hypothetical protein [Actinomycetota bacterium]